MPFQLRPPRRVRSATEDTNKGAGVLVVCATTRRILLAKRGMHCPFAEHWAPFGGKVDPGETTLEAAVREVIEEASVNVDVPDADFIKEVFYVNHPVGPKQFTFYTYVAFLQVEPQVTLNDESSGYAWFKITDLPTPMHPGFIELLESSNGIHLTGLLTDPGA